MELADRVGHELPTTDPVALGDWFARPRREMIGEHMRDVIGERAFAERERLLEAALKGEAQFFASLFDHPGRGERDPLNTDDELQALAADPVTLPGLGHNAHVEDPDAVWALVAGTLRRR